jgi:hypothetical protein
VPALLFMVELPGIETAYSTPQLHKRPTGEHRWAWGNVAEQENVLTAVSTLNL